MKAVIQYACLTNYLNWCVCAPGQKTDCGVVVWPKPAKPAKPRK